MFSPFSLASRYGTAKLSVAIWELETGSLEDRQTLKHITFFYINIDFLVA